MPAKPHAPTERNRGLVEGMAAVGVREDEIAKILRIAPKTLRKRYRKELDTSHIKATAAVANALYKNAVEKNNIAAQIFWMKTRGGWRESPIDVNHSGNVGTYDLSKVNNADLQRLKTILAPAVAGGGRGGDSPTRD